MPKENIMVLINKRRAKWLVFGAMVVLGAVLDTVQADYLTLASKEVPRVLPGSDIQVRPCSISVDFEPYPDKASGWRVPGRYHLSLEGQNFYSINAITDKYTGKAGDHSRQEALQYWFECFQVKGRSFVFLDGNRWRSALDLDHPAEPDSSDCLGFTIDSGAVGQPVSFPLLKGSCSPVVINSHLSVGTNKGEILLWLQSVLPSFSGEDEYHLFNSDLSRRLTGRGIDLRLFSPDTSLVVTGYISEFGNKKYLASPSVSLRVLKESVSSNEWSEILFPVSSPYQVVPILGEGHTDFLVGKSIQPDPSLRALITSDMPSGTVTRYRTEDDGSLIGAWTQSIAGLLKIEPNYRGQHFDLKVTVATGTVVHMLCAYIPGIHCIDDYGASYKTQVVNYYLKSDGSGLEIR